MLTKEDFNDRDDFAESDSVVSSLTLISVPKLAVAKEFCSGVKITNGIISKIKKIKLFTQNFLI